LVEVKVYGNAPQPVVGRSSLQLLNTAFEDLAYKGVVSLLIQMTPRFPELGADGVVRQKVRVFHHRDGPVFIHQAALVRHRMDPLEPVSPVPTDAAALMGSFTIPPGRGLEFEAKLDTNVAPDLFSMDYLLEGKDSAGLPARGAFSVMRPPPTPTKENSAPVVDAALKAKIIAARKMLNRPFVTDEDLWQLEREGKFAHLQLPSESATPPAPMDPREAKQAVEPPSQGPTSTEGAPAASTKVPEKTDKRPPR
jgi:hypothetical protein